MISVTTDIAVSNFFSQPSTYDITAKSSADHALDKVGFLSEVDDNFHCRSRLFAVNFHRSFSDKRSVQLVRHSACHGKELT